MVKKFKSEAVEYKKTQGLISFVHQIWLAGLGAFARIESEGSKFFEALVQEGEEFESRTRESANQKIKEVKEKTGDVWSELEQTFEEYIASALNKIGVPTNEDIQTLSKRVEELNESIKSLRKL